MATNSTARISDSVNNATELSPTNVPLANYVGPSIHPALMKVTCEKQEDAIQLFGEVPTFYLKQLAQESASRLPNVRIVHNQIQVRSAPCDWR